jgi:PAS domain-containing protein
MDLTEAKIQIANLKEQLEIEKALNDVAFEAIGIFDEDLKCIAANAEAVHVLGYTSEELLHLTAFDFLAKDDPTTEKWTRS